jgi:acetyl/propionyl-CoA carboxylase alpha subunit
VDIVAEQIRIAADEPLSVTQEQIRLNGHAMVCRINAEDPWNDYLPSPGELRRFRLPQGPGVRVDTYGYVGCQIPVRYDSLLAKVAVWDDTRAACISRLLRALQEFRIVGVQTNLPLHLQILRDPGFVEGRVDTNFMQRFHFGSYSASDEERRDVAAMAAVAYLLRNRMARPVVPQRLQSGWHRSARRLPV